jgi:hypothetical protein
MDVSSTLEIDPLGHLTRFRSSLRVSGMRESVVITGRAQASRLIITVESGSTQSPNFEANLPRDALVADELSPTSRINGLRLNQEWTVPVFSPLRPPTNPVEILQAKVESRQPIEWEGKVTPAFAVVYRADSGSLFYSSKQARSKLWVRDDGLVLKQEVNVLGSRLVFTRMNAEKSEEIAAEADRDEERQRTLRKERFLQMQKEFGHRPWEGPPRYTDGDQGRPWPQRRGFRYGNFSNNPQNIDPPSNDPPSSDPPSSDESERPQAQVPKAPAAESPTNEATEESSEPARSD